jgi:hypothetical protein
VTELSSAQLDRFHSKIDKTDSCWLWRGTVTRYGYGHFCVHHGKTVRAHRLMVELTTGQPIPSGLEVCHSCDVRNCVNPDHLFLGTRTDNMRDAQAKGRLATGERRSHLTADQVREIRSSWPEVGQYELARRFAIPQSAISRIIHRETWKEVA